MAEEEGIRGQKRGELDQVGCAKARRWRTSFLIRELNVHSIGDGNILQKEYSGLFGRVLHVQDDFLRARRRKENKLGRYFQVEWLSEQ